MHIRTYRSVSGPKTEKTLDKLQEEMEQFGKDARQLHDISKIQTLKTELFLVFHELKGQCCCSFQDTTTHHYHTPKLKLDLPTFSGNLYD